MATEVIQHTYKLKRGKQEAVERVNPILSEGEPVVVYCNDGKTRMKVGDGQTPYKELNFIGEGEGSAKEILEFESRLNFPGVGDPHMLYRATKDSKLYQFNSSKQIYELLNEFQGEITIDNISFISGGTADALLESIK